MGGLADFDLYPYTPSAPAGWTFLVLFSIGGVTHLAIMCVTRSWYFLPFILGCAGEAAGYYGRAWSHKNIRDGGPYLIQLMLILASAPLIAATVYMMLGRLVRALDAEKLAILPTRWTTKIYVLIDIISFGCQMSGSAMQSSGDPAGVKLGNNIVIGGLAFQLVAFVCFIVMAAIVHKGLNRQPTLRSQNSQATWTRQFWNLYLVSALIFVRSAFRLIEFAQGPQGTLYKSEIYLYVFDASIMFSVVILLAIVHPGIALRMIRKTGTVLDDEPNISLVRGSR